MSLHPVTWENQQMEDLKLLSGSSSSNESIDSVVQPFGCGESGRIMRMDADAFEKSPDTLNGMRAVNISE
jgi:hypothetical protein